MACDTTFPIPLPDDPRKWRGWSNYNSPSFYERLCLDPRSNPSNELIEEHCRELLRWWQKKLPLKNQPSNPLAQILRGGLDESSRYISEARVELLDPEKRQKIDDQLAAQEFEAAVAEFGKYFSFATVGGFLTAEDEQNLIRFGDQHGLSTEQITNLIEEKLAETGVTRAKPLAQSAQASASPADTKPPGNPQEEFMRLLRLSGLESDSMTDDQRDALINMAENLGLDPGEAEDMVDAYLEEMDAKPVVAAPPPKPRPQTAPISSTSKPLANKRRMDFTERARHPNFRSSLGAEMLFIPPAEFTMGSDDPEAAPNERPQSKVALDGYYLSRHLVTNADYEKFDPSHAQKRMPGGGDHHPVVYVSYIEANKFCQWLSARERRKYRLPTEAEWEYAARGSDARRFPWGNHRSGGELANFADKNTHFAWSDLEIDDGYAETSPVGAFPLGASPFGVEDMSGNVWEWCLDYYAPYSSAPKVNPRGPAAGTRRAYRGGSWKSRFTSLRTTTRGSDLPIKTCNDLGFRVACDCAP